MLKVGAIIALLLVVGCSVSPEPEELGAVMGSRLAKHEDSTNSDYLDGTYTVREIWDFYQANEARGNADFLDRYVIVSGQVGRVRDDRIDFALSAGAVFADPFQPELVKYDPGDSLVLSCRSGGLILDSFLAFDDCIPLPKVISYRMIELERIVEPSGGAAIENTAGLSCDRVLKNQLVFQRAASMPDRMNAVIKQVQAQRTECAADIWDPAIAEKADGNNGCQDVIAVGDTDVPRGLQKDTDGKVRDNSSRDSENNLIIHFDATKLPTDSAKCWLYSARLRTWDQVY